MTALRQASFAAILLGGLFLALPAQAHWPYEKPSGSFTRSDGVTVSVVRHFDDGIFGRDPVSVQFRLPNGRVIAETGHILESVVVKMTHSGAEVYRFKSDWMPIASRVQQFDGYALMDVSSQPQRWMSILIHTREHLWHYANVFGLMVSFVAGWFAVKTIPNRGWLALVRAGGFISLVLAASLGAVLVLWVMPVSPLILCAATGLGVALGSGMVGLKQFAARRHSQSV